MKKSKILVIVAIFIVAILVITVVILLNRNNENSLVVDNAYNIESNSQQNNSNNISSSSKITWIRNESLKTDSNSSDEENAVKTTNVNTNSLTNITLGEFVNKWTENSETNFLSAYPLENMVEPAEIKKGEMLWSTRDFYIKGVLPGFEMRFTAKHPDYLEEDFLGTSEKDINVSDFIVTNIQFEGNMDHLYESYLV